MFSLYPVSYCGCCMLTNQYNKLWVRLFNLTLQ